MRKDSIPIIINVAINIYRTKKHTVKQYIYFTIEKDEHPILCSDDVYYLRTAEREKDYNKKYKNSHFPDGQRIHTYVYTRYYAD